MPLAERLADAEEVIGQRSIAGAEARHKARDKVGPNYGKEEE
jgi:hypothetical protein